MTNSGSESANRPDTEGTVSHKGAPAVSKTVSIGTKVAAWILTAIYVGVVLIILNRFGFGDGSGGNWEHTLIIFNALSAIGFAAVGVLLGTTVQQVNVANAQKEAVSAKANEANMAMHSRELADAASQKLYGSSETLNILPADADTRLHDAISNMRKVLAQRPS